METLLINLLTALLAALVGWLRQRKVVMEDQHTPTDVRERWHRWIRSKLQS